MAPPDRAAAQALDAADPLRGFRDRFLVADPDLLYLDGNSLGRLPRASVDRLRHVVEDEWGRGLVRSWARWVDAPTVVGDLLGSALLGAAPGQVVVCDSTTVNLHKLAVAAVDARPGRRRIVSDAGNFPTDRYVLEGVAARHGLDLVLVDCDELEGPSAQVLSPYVDGDTALLALSHVDYRSGAVADLPALTALAHDAGALALWDVAHSAGSVPVGLDAAGADLAVGCTYKYVDAGPGAPAFLYVRRDLQDALRQPIWGWFGQRDQFAMGAGYDPQPGIGRFLTGTPSILGTALVEEGVAVLAEAGVDRLHAKGQALTSLLVDLHDAWLAPLGFTLASPRDPRRRGAHVSLAHPEAWRITRALLDHGVVPDFRGPDRLRLGPAPITTRFVDVWDAMDRLRDVVASGAFRVYDETRARVT